MKFTFKHTNLTILDLKKSLAFYKEALGLEEVRRIDGRDFTIVYVGDGVENYLLELTWYHNRTIPYNLGDNENHIAFGVDDVKAAHALHEKMACVVYDNPAMGIYFITDPDGYWLEVVPNHR